MRQHFYHSAHEVLPNDVTRHANLWGIVSSNAGSVARQLFIGAIVASQLAGCGRSNESTAEPTKSSPKSLPAGLAFKGTGGTQSTDASAEWGQCFAQAEAEGMKVFCKSPYAYTLAVGAKRVEVAPGDDASLMVDLVPAFGSLRVARDKGDAKNVVFENVDPATTVQITFANGTSLKGAPAPIDRIYHLDPLRRALKKPLTFGPDEPPHPAGAPHSIVFVTDDPDPSTYRYGDARVIGPAATFHEVDWVVVTASDELRDGGRKCGGYTFLGGGGPETKVPLKLEEQTLVIQDRRTGVEIGRKTFLAPKSCPTSATKDSAISYVDPAVQQAWMRAEVLKH